MTITCRYLSAFFKFSLFSLAINYISCADVAPDVTKGSQSKQIIDLVNNIVQLANYYKTEIVNAKYDLSKTKSQVYEKKAQEYIKSLQKLIPSQSQYRSSYLDTVLDSFKPATFKRIIRNKTSQEEFFNSLKNIKNFGAEKFELTDIGDFGVVPDEGSTKPLTGSAQLDESARLFGSGLRKFKDIAQPTYVISDEYFDTAIKEIVSWSPKATSEKITALQLLAACYYDKHAKQMKADTKTFNSNIINQINKILYSLKSPTFNASFVKVREVKKPRQVAPNYSVDYNYHIANYGYISSKKINDLIQMGEGDVLRGFCALSGDYVEDIKSYKRNPSEIRKMEAVHILQRYRQTFSICALRQKKFDTANVQKILKPLDEDIARLKEKITEEYTDYPSKIKPKNRMGPRTAATTDSTPTTSSAVHIYQEGRPQDPRDVVYMTATNRWEDAENIVDVNYLKTRGVGTDIGKVVNSAEQLRQRDENIQSMEKAREAERKQQRVQDARVASTPTTSETLTTASTSTATTTSIAPVATSTTPASTPTVAGAEAPLPAGLPTEVTAVKVKVPVQIQPSGGNTLNIEMTSDLAKELDSIKKQFDSIKYLEDYDNKQTSISLRRVEEMQKMISNNPVAKEKLENVIQALHTQFDTLFGKRWGFSMPSKVELENILQGLDTLRTKIDSPQAERTKKNYDRIGGELKGFKNRVSIGKFDAHDTQILEGKIRGIENRLNYDPQIISMSAPGPVDVYAAQENYQAIPSYVDNYSYAIEQGDLPLIEKRQPLIQKKQVDNQTWGARLRSLFSGGKEATTKSAKPGTVAMQPVTPAVQGQQSAGQDSFDKMIEGFKAQDNTSLWTRFWRMIVR